MRILATVAKSYYGRANSTEPMYLWFTQPLVRLGHEVDHFDHAAISARDGLHACGNQFLQRVRAGRYDLVLYQTGGRDMMDLEAIERARRHAPIVAWNSDDDWQWESYSRLIAPLFSHVVTTYRHVYERNRMEHPNLVLSQWGCLDTFADFERTADLDFTFAGQIYTSRVADCLYLKRNAGLEVFGLGSIRIRYPIVSSRSAYRVVAQWFPWVNRPLGFRQVHDIWNRSKVSYTPLAASGDPSKVQLKGRVFEMGASGTMMLAQRNPEIEEFYEPGVEFVPYDSLEDCAEKARYYVENDEARMRIATAYCRRTRAEHLWEHRFRRLFRDIGLEAPAARPAVRRVA